MGKNGKRGNIGSVSARKCLLWGWWDTELPSLGAFLVQWKVPLAMAGCYEMIFRVLSNPNHCGLNSLPRHGRVWPQRLKIPGFFRELQFRSHRARRQRLWGKSWKENSLTSSVALQLLCQHSRFLEQLWQEPSVPSGHCQPFPSPAKARAHLLPGVPASCHVPGEWHTWEKGTQNQNISL